VVEPEDKRRALRHLIGSEDVKNALIFCNRKKDVDILQKSLARHGFDAAALHGDMSQPKRTETLERFKNDEIRLLVCSDVAARGLDIQGLSHVFNFDVPYHAEDYVHRIGRTGRAGREGRAFTLAAPEEGKAVAAIQALIGRDIPNATVPDIDVAELDFEGSDRRRGRGRAPSARRKAPERATTGAEPQDAPSPRKRVRAATPSEPRREPRHAAVTPFPARNIRPAPERRPVAASAAASAAEPRVVGFGDDLPAFLARPLKVARA
jgi:superfamily II DNA/RNA helicase